MFSRRTSGQYSETPFDLYKTKDQGVDSTMSPMPNLKQLMLQEDEATFANFRATGEFLNKNGDMSVFTPEQ